MLPKCRDLLPSLCLVALLALLVLTFLALARQSVEVRVYDAHTGTLLSQAEVKSSTPVQRQRTPDGWLFLGVSRRLSVHITSPGYLPTEAFWFASHPWILQGRLDVRLSHTQLNGLVRDAETGAPLPGAEVSIGTQKVNASASGMFRLSSLAGDNPVSVQLECYEPWQGEVLWQEHLLQGELMIVDLWPNYAQGWVRAYETGEPLPGTRVSVEGQQSIADQQGQFRLGCLQEGDVVTVDREYFWPTEVIYAGEPLDIVLESALVEGQIRNGETGDPLAGAMVMAGEQKHLTDQAGRLRLHRLQPGDIITVERECFWPSEVSYAGKPLDVAMQERWAQVVVSSALEDETLSDIRVTHNGQALAEGSSGVFDLQVCATEGWLEGTARGHWPSQVQLSALDSEAVGEVETIVMVLQPLMLTVTVRDDYSGWPLAGASVVGSPAHPTSEKGEAVLAPAVPGMTIVVEHPGYISQTVQYEGQTSELEVRLVPHTLHGIVIDADSGEPVPGAALRRNGRTLQRTTLDGGFRLENLTERPVFAVHVPGYRSASMLVDDHASAVRPRACPEEVEVSGSCWEIRLPPFEARGVYMPLGLLYSRQRTLSILDMISNTELNAVVVDVKGDWGWLAYDSELPLVTELGNFSSGVMDIHEFLDLCRQRDIYTIARLVVFKDNPLAQAKTDLAIKRADGSLWVDREEMGWANPYREEVWDYNIGIAKEVAQLGFDEVQLDYLRFPSDGDVTQIVYEEQDSMEAKTTAIRTFMARMREALEPYDVFLSADIFGLTLSVDPRTDMGIGQRVIDIAPYVDYLCPMVYPSTFTSGNLGIANPVLHPYEVVAESLRRGMALTTTRIRPWLQAYSIAGVTYGLAEQRAQRQAAEALGADGWTYWHAGGRYDERLFRQRVVADAEHLKEEETID